MGKGDQRTKRGKIYRGTHGKTHSKKEPPKPKGEPKPASRPRPERPTEGAPG